MDANSYIPLFTRYSSYLLTTHLNPDGDGLGSQIALYEFLTSKRKHVRCINHSPTPRHYKFLDPEDEIIEVFDHQQHSEFISNVECIVIIDTNYLSRLGDMENLVRESRGIKIVIDHHLDKDEIATHYIVDEDAAATGEIMYKLLTALTDGHISDSMATALYTAIMTDTGSFRFPKTNRETHLITADLLQYKVDPASIFQEIYERGPVNRLHLLGLALSTLQLHCDDRIATMYVSKEMLDRTRTDVAETDGFVNYTLQIDNVEIGILITETDENIKISFRSRGDIWINELAKEFDGNGHQHAAGATVRNGTLQELLHQVVSRARKYLPEKRNNYHDESSI